MGQSAAQTVKEIEQVRDRITDEVRELEERLPPPAKLVRRTAGITLGGGVGGTAFWVVVRRMRKRRQKAKSQAIVVDVLPPRVSDALSNGEWKQYVAGAAVVWLLVRLAELRQLRRLNRAMLVSP